MKDLIDVVDLRGLLQSAGVDAASDDFEAVYSSLRSLPGREPVVHQVEERVFAYFDQLRVPVRPTLYDHLVLSLRPKDVIATFNWDPLLYQALRRCQGLADPPLLLHLHGCTAIGYCDHGRRITWGDRAGRCSRCGGAFRPAPILYPVAQKDYARDPMIRKAWSLVRRVLKQAYLVTVFGYSAPKTDFEARRLLSSGWGRPAKRELEEFEFVDIRPGDDLAEEWRDFICETHYRSSRDFYQSTAGEYPRRGCEAVLAQVMDLQFPDPCPLPRRLGWKRLEGCLEPLLAAEAQARRARNLEERQRRASAVGAKPIARD